MFSAKNIAVGFAIARGVMCEPAAAAPAHSCLLIIADSTISFNGSVSSQPAYETSSKDEWARTMMARAQTLTSHELARDLKGSYPFYIRYADFATEVYPRTDWVLISGEKDLAGFGSQLAALPRAVRATTHSYKALTWAVGEVKNCPADDRGTLYRINIETDGTASDTRQDSFLQKGVYLDPNLIALTQAAYHAGITINALGIAYTTGTRPAMDNNINLAQVVRDNFRTPNGKSFVVRTPEEFSAIYRIKLNNDMAESERPTRFAGGLPTRPALTEPNTLLALAR